MTWHPPGLGLLGAAALAVAVSACSSGQAPSVASLPGHSHHGATTHGTAGGFQQVVNFARCMRGHDIAMLNPDSSGNLNLSNVPGISGDFGRYSPQFQAADTACRHLLPAGVHDNGTGP